MEVSSLCRFLLLSFLVSGSTQVSVIISPNKSQFFKHESFSVGCEEEDEDVSKWKVMKRTTDGEVSPCPSTCSVSAAYPVSDSGEYWCEDKGGETSNSINITTTDGPVILEMPGLPVIEGEDVVLRCRHEKIKLSRSSIHANFFKNDSLIGGMSKGILILPHVDRSDEGQYKCKITGFDESPASRLTVRGSVIFTSPPPHTTQVPPAPALSLSTMIRHLVVGSPYLLSTILLGLIFRDRVKVRQWRKQNQTSSDVVMEMDACNLCH